jgi:hypothetical protein
MSLPLKDFRLGVTETIDIMLDAQATAFGLDKAAVARNVLSDWARKKMHEHKVMARRLAANGIQPELFGDDTEDGGASRSARKSP